jgi:hypothetical protein
MNRCLSVIVVVSLLHAFVVPLFATGPAAEREARQVAKAKEVVTKLGTGKKATTTVNIRAGAVLLRSSASDAGGRETKVNLLTKTEMQGYVSQIGEDSFALTDPKRGENTTISYQDVLSVRSKSSSKLVLAEIGVVTGIIVGVLAIWAAMYAE